jgi:hypothetical protein
MRRRILGTAAAVVAAAPAGAQQPGGETFTPSQALASPTVTVGGKTADRLCSLGASDTLTAIAVAMPAPPTAPRSCSAQNVRPMTIGRARSARIDLQAPADRLLAGWHRNGATTPLQPARTGPRRWRLTLPATSGRLLLFAVFEIDTAAIGYELRTDWKLAVRRSLRRPAPASRPEPPAPSSTFRDSG